MPGTESWAKGANLIKLCSLSYSHIPKDRYTMKGKMRKNTWPLGEDRRKFSFNNGFGEKGEVSPEKSYHMLGLLRAFKISFLL